MLCCLLCCLVTEWWFEIWPLHFLRLPCVSLVSNSFQPPLSVFLFPRVPSLCLSATGLLLFPFSHITHTHIYLSSRTASVMIMRRSEPVLLLITNVRIRRRRWWRHPHWLPVTVKKHGIIPIDRQWHCVKKWCHLHWLAIKVCGKDVSWVHSRGALSHALLFVIWMWVALRQTHVWKELKSSKLKKCKSISGGKHTVEINCAKKRAVLRVFPLVSM